MKYAIRKAVEADVDVVADIIRERTRWLAEHGTDQWSNRDQAAVFIEAFGLGHSWVVEDETGIVGTFSLADTPPDYWPKGLTAEPALYLYKMATTSAASGHGLGRRMVQASADIAAHRGVEFVRWDAWTDNKELHAYYDGLPGTRRVGVTDAWLSGQLFELDAPAHIIDMDDTTIQF